MTPDQTDKMRRRIVAKQSQQLGEWGQRCAQLALQRGGFEMVERIETGTRQIRGVRRFTQRASGDIRAVGKDGRSVLVEVKVRADKLLRSDLEEHQRRSLQQHHDAGGQSLVAWVVDRTTDCLLLPWPVWPDGGGRGTSIDVDAARRRAIKIN